MYKKYKKLFVPIIHDPSQFTEEHIKKRLAELDEGTNLLIYDSTSNCIRFNSLDCTPLINEDREDLACKNCVVTGSNISVFIEWCIDSNYITKETALQLTMDFT